MNKEKVFTTSMNRKVCYEEGYNQALKDAIKKIDGTYYGKGLFKPQIIITTLKIIEGLRK